jgi:hypothetical protein
MVDKMQDQSNRTTQIAPIINNGANGHTQLLQLLNIGPKALTKQIRYVLMLSQIVGQKSSATMIPQKPLTTHYARLQSLANMADSLSDEHLKRLYTEIEAVRNARVRLSLLLQIAPKLPQSLDIMRKIWEQLNTLADPSTETLIMFQLVPLVPEAEEFSESPSILAQVVEIALHLNDLEARIKSLIALYPYLPEELFETYIRAILNELFEKEDDELSSKSLRTLAEYLPESLAPEALTLLDRIRSASYRAHALTALAQYLPVEKYRRLHEKALDTIETIADEAERADALIAFTDYLESAEEEQEYPQLLEKALSIAITISSPEYRARVLVALAPNLTEDLQREALASVQSLASEWEQAHLLSKLIPMLSPEMLMKSLVMAEAIKVLEYRAQVLTILAQYVPQHVRQQTMMDALYAASNLPNAYERVQALVNLREWLPHILQEEILLRTLTTVEQMENDSAKARALNLLAEHLTPTQLEDALAIAREISNPQIYFNAASGFVEKVFLEQKTQLVEEMLDCIRNIRLPYKRAQAIISLAPYVNPQQLLEVLAMAESISEAIDQINVYVSLAQRIPASDERRLLLDKAVIRLKRITDGYDRANAMITIMPHLEPDRRADLQKEVYETIERANDTYEKASAITLLAPLLEGDSLSSTAKLPDILTIFLKGFERALQVPDQKTRSDLMQEGASLWIEFSDADNSYTLWKSLAPRLISLPLADVLLCLEAIRPILQQIAGTDYTKAIAYILGMR